ncbi:MULTISPECIES: DUF2513 domain-containing protein [unclassified Fusobacterium]|uniref:DUF2513 domain-containing protein n=1 Tax=unclassified Fusobacterium TaxID=2648384 RepID=UPI001B8C8842|nr:MULTISPECIES: DUF2513 domain-containing protein [unclassified Fusobacterium]MBR8701669.1 hypothetical protein [Fusobacterium sp. DD45]MBR8711450.1 hypothetical protein [Fusobacterium sp. DD28]MBR8751999.1 hypothetical protein [Fusobacterium sp. DD26]
MKMDIECIRNILLQAEERSFLVTRQTPSLVEDEKNDRDNKIVCKFIESYDVNKLLYHIDLAEELGLIKCSNAIGYSAVLDLTAQGHLLLADIREENIWNQTKEISNKIGATSLDSIKQIAINVASSLIANYFQK